MPSGGNIEKTGGPDPFPRTGLVKQYEPFIRKWVGEFCAAYPGAIYEHVLVDAVRIAVEVEARFNPALGFDFSTFLRKHLLGLNRLFRNERQQIKIPEPAKEKQEPEEAVPLVYCGGNGARITIERRWRNGSGWHRVLIARQLRSRNEGEARAEVDRMSSALSKLLDNRPISEIRADVRDVAGAQANVKFLKGRKPPNFHKWPSTVLFVSFNEAVTRDDAEGTLRLEDVLGPDPRSFKHSDPDVDKLRRAIDAERPFLSPSERKLLEWKLDPLGGRPGQWAAKNGISKGWASKLNDRVTARLADRMKQGS
jgi:hypothetical protein